MRSLFALALMTTSAFAWEAGTDGHICTLSHRGDTQVHLTYDPNIPEYAITLTSEAGWPIAPVLGIRFDGPAMNYITTDRHELSADGYALSVRDRGFGNVLDGLQYNLRLIAMTGSTARIVELEGAAPAVADFRTCTEAPSA